MSEGWNGWWPEGELLKGRVAVIAGGGGGIGAATTRILGAAGATVVVVDQFEEGAAAVVRDVEAEGGTALAVIADLRDEAACAAAIARAATEFGGIDILANVAGGMHRHASWRPLKEWTTDAWDTIVHVNLGYVFWLCRAVIPVMEARGGGAIVNVASVAAEFGSPDQSPYGAAKAALVQLTKTLAVECGPDGIRVNAVSPGVTLTEAARVALTDDAQAPLIQATPLRQLGRPEDIARAILFFASPMAEHITGQTLAVEGGVGIAFPYPGLYSR